MFDELRTSSVGGLLGRYSQLLDELERREVIRTRNAPAGDYAEWLCARALGGVLDKNSQKSSDLTLPTGERVQVKCRVVSDPIKAGERQASVFRSWDFELAAFVLLDRRTYAVRRGVLLPVQTARAFGRRVDHVNADRVMIRAELLDHRDARDITGELQKASLEH